MIAKNDVFVVSAVRTPIGSKNGYLRNWTAPELLGAALDEAIHRIDLDPELVDEVVTGCVYQLGEQGFNIARMGILSSRLPIKTPGVSVNRQCGSSLTAIQIAHMMIASGNMDVVIASGCELMSKYSIMSDMNGTLYTGEPMNHPITKRYIEIFGIPDQIAFAPIPLAWAKELKADTDKLNVNGGAMALGHPVGNSGCRLSITAIHELQRRNARYALVTLCTGGGQAPATIFERA